MIRSGSTLFRDPVAATAGGSPSLFFRTIRGRGGKHIGAYTVATENRPGCRNLSNLCLSEFMLSLENKGLNQENGIEYIIKNSWAFLIVHGLKTTKKKHK
jgi:hypothetical protein